MLLDYNLLLVIGLCLFFCSNFILLLNPGEGLLFLQDGRWHVQVPSWRAAFNGKLLVFLNPLRVLMPVTKIGVFAPAGSALPQLEEEASKLQAAAGGTALIALFASLFIVFGVSTAILLHRNVAYILLNLALAYGCYLLVLFRGWHYSRNETLAPGVASAALEALFCLPYAAQLMRRISLLMLPRVPLITLLSSKHKLDAATLRNLQARVQEYRDTIEDPAQATMLTSIAELIEQQLAKEANE